MTKNFYSFTDAYRSLLSDVYNEPSFKSAPRGQKIREQLGVAFKILNPAHRLPFVSAREFSLSYYVAESLWYLSGNDSTEWISKYSSFWKNISDDGTTANSAYGSRIFRPHDRVAKDVDPLWTQWDYIIDELSRDNDSRRAVVHIRSPKDSILASKDVPCTLSLQFFLREDKVHMVVSMRSSDLILGIAYDVPAFTLFQELLAVQLSKKLHRSIGVGEYTHISNSLHIYERHFKMVEEILSEDRFESVALDKLPDEIPMQDLLNFEDKCSKASSKSDIFEIVQNLSIEDYWKDWCKILASNRLTKLSENQEAQRMLNSTTQEAYKFFKK